MNLNSDFKYPQKKIFSGVLNRILNINSPFQSLFSESKLKSDIENVVYLNWMIPFKDVEHLIPKGVEVEVFEGKVLLTVLNYNHGHFRPNSLSPIKFIFGSPNQSNWRLYLKTENPTPNGSGVLFITNVLSQFFYTFGSRLFSQILKAHWPISFNHLKKENQYYSKIISGLSHAPDLDVQLVEKDEWKIPNSFHWMSKDIKTLLKTICNQDMAITKVNEDKLCKAEIRLDFYLATIKPLILTRFESNTLKDTLKNAECLAFVIPKLTFYSLGEKLIEI